MFCGVVRFQPAGVHQDVEEVPEERETRREHVHGAREDDERGGRESEPKLNARSGGMRPAATGRFSVRFPISLSMSLSRTWFRAEAPPQARASPAIAAANVAHDTSPPAPAKNPPAAGEEEQRHDPRLRQGDVVAPRSSRRRSSVAERGAGRHGRGLRARRLRAPRAGRPPSRRRRRAQRPRQGHLDDEERERRAGPRTRSRRSGRPSRAARNVAASSANAISTEASWASACSPVATTSAVAAVAPSARSRSQALAARSLLLPHLQSHVPERTVARHEGYAVEVVRRRRRGGVPLERVGAPGIGADPDPPASSSPCSR